MEKKYILIALIVFVVIILAVVFFSLPKPKSSTVPSPSPTSAIPTKFIVSPSISPTLIPPGAFTGVKEETLPAAVLDLTAQKQDLRKRSPLTEIFGTINFDYGQDKFTVSLKSPKKENRSEFEKWKNSNYPGIPLDRFIIN